MKRIYVNTPKGEKYHGFIEGNVFIRNVAEKDLMRIFCDWAISPEALEKISGEVSLLRYIHDNGTIYEVDIDTVKQKGFEKEFAGGKTIYLPLKFWKTIYKKNLVEEKKEPQKTLF